MTCHPLVAAALIGENGQRLEALSRALGKEIIVKGQSDRQPDTYALQAVHQLEERPQQAGPVMPQEIVRLVVTAVHKEEPDDGIGRIEGYVIQIRGAASAIGQEILVEIERVYATYAIARPL